MKNFITSICIICLLCAGIIINSIYIENKYSQIKYMLDSFPQEYIEAYSNQASYMAHLNTLERLEKKWKQTKKISQLSIAHDETADFVNALASAKSYYATKDFKEFVNQIALIKNALDHMISHEKISFDNIF